MSGLEHVIAKASGDAGGGAVVGAVGDEVVEEVSEAVGEDAVDGEVRAATRPVQLRSKNIPDCVRYFLALEC